MPQTPPYDYKDLCVQLLRKLMPIFGRDAVIQTVYSIREIELSSQDTLKKIHGDPQLVFEKLVDEFSELSQFVVQHVTHELHVEHESKYSQEVSGIR